MLQSRELILAYNHAWLDRLANLEILPAHGPHHEGTVVRVDSSSIPAIPKNVIVRVQWDIEILGSKISVQEHPMTDLVTSDGGNPLPWPVCTEDGLDISDEEFKKWCPNILLDK